MRAQKNKIAPISIFFLFYISRIVVTLTCVQSVTSTMLRQDMLISIVFALGLSILAALPVICCYRKHKNPVDIKLLGLLYALYFIFAAGVDISRFSYFASTTLNPDSKAALFIVIIGACMLYAALLGIEGLARFSAFGFILMLIAVASVFVFNLKNYSEINLYPVISNQTDTILYNALSMTAGNVEIILFLPLVKRVNGDAVKHFVGAVCASLFTVFLLMLFIFGVMGDSASLHSFPLYTLFQLAKLGDFERIDVLHISFWIFGIFIKTSLLIYCASICIKPFSQKNKCIISAVLSVAAAFALSLTTVTGDVQPAVHIILFVVFAVVIPVLTLIFKKRNRGEELIEKF